MSDVVAQQLEARIRAHRPLALPGTWADEVVFPHYDGLSLRNIPHTIAALLGAPFADHAPLDAAVWGDHAPADIQRVVLFLMDGLGYQHLRMVAEEDPEIRQLVADVTQGRGVVPLTSTAPSTTAVALTALWTGGTPGQTGILGTVMYLRELSTLGNMLRFRPMTGRHEGNIFEAWGYPPAAFAQRGGIGTHLAQAEVPSYVVQYQALMGSGLSGILHGGVAEPAYLHSGYSDMILRMEDALRATRGERCYINVYWAAVDTLAHAHGAHNRYTRREIKLQLSALRELLANPDLHDGQTLFILTADHGHHDVQHRHDLMEDALLAPLRDAMILGLSGDNRLPYIHLRPGTLPAVQDHLAANCGDWLMAVETDALLAAGVFGETLPPALRTRLGDLVLIPRLGHVVDDPSVTVLPLVSWHAGLSDWEMLIPFLWQRF